MPGRRPGGGAASIFSSLPAEIKAHLRAQILGPQPVGPAPTQQFMSTQPAEDSSDEPDEKQDDGETTQDLGDDRKRKSEIVASGSGDIDTSSKRRRIDDKKIRNDDKGTGKDGISKRWDCSDMVTRFTNYNQVPSHLKKYYAQRTFLFQDYDKLNLLMDETGWFSVTPESIAQHTAERCRADTVIDAFCGVGGNVIQLAMTCERVIAIDNDLQRLKLARHNAMQYGVADRVEWICADFVEYAEAYGRRVSEGKGKGKAKAALEVDVVFLSPPWGGVDYLEENPANGSSKTANGSFALSRLLPVSGQELYKISSAFTPNIAIFLPRNLDLDEVAALAPDVMDENGTSIGKETVEVEESHIGMPGRSKVKALTVYFGGLANSS